MARRLIINADDLGQCDGINRGIAAAVEHGVVTSTSLMVRWPAAESAATWCRRNPAVSVGLHVDLGEWTHVNGYWQPLYEVVDSENFAAVHDEVARQLGMFLRLLGRTPSHLDGHQHVQRNEPLRSHLAEVASRLNVPVRDVSPQLRYCGSYYGQYGPGHPFLEGITFEALLSILDELPDGTTELGCHPACGDLSDLQSMYRHERIHELAVLTDSRLAAEIAAREIELCSFRAVVTAA